MKSLYLAILFAGIVASIPVKIKSNAEIRIDDMLLTAEQNELLFASSKPTSRNGVRNPTYIWENATVYYWIDPKISDENRQLVVETLNKIVDVTCLKFIQGANPKGHYIRVNSDDPGCYSWVGYKERVQSLNLGYGCFDEGIILHEFLHALGFHHQHNSYERDDFIEIHLENVAEEDKSYFAKYSRDTVSNFGTRYDYNSIMHPKPTEYSKNGRPTIVAKFPSEATEFGQTKRLTDTDILKINRMYKCES